MAGAACRDIRDAVARDVRGAVARDVRGAVTRDIRGAVTRDIRGAVTRDIRGAVTRDRLRKRSRVIKVRPTFSATACLLAPTDVSSIGSPEGPSLAVVPTGHRGPVF